jgi:hypothetical protein
MTQKLIANMFGVRREGVTEAAGKPQAAGLIHLAERLPYWIVRSWITHDIRRNKWAGCAPERKFIFCVPNTQSEERVKWFRGCRRRYT